MRNRTSAAMNARNRSTKSWFIAQLAAQAPEILTETPDLDDPLPLRNRQPELEVVAVRILERVEPPRDDPPGTLDALVTHGSHYDPTRHGANARPGRGRHSECCASRSCPRDTRTRRSAR